MAEGYAHATGRPGVAMVTSGPAATNIVTPLCDAMLDSIPFVCITGQVPLSAIGTDAFQECDTTGITMPVTKHNWLIQSAADIPTVIREAFYVATTGRPGPVLVDIPKDIANQTMEWYWPDGVDLPGFRAPQPPDPRLAREAARLILAAERPVIYAGGGILKARAAEALRRLAELTGIHVVTTLMARGAFPDDHPQCLGMPGMHGNYTAVTAMQQSDLLIALGSRFDDRVTGKVPAFAPQAKIIHVDIDPAEIGKVRRADVGIAADCRAAIEAITAAVEYELRRDGHHRPRPVRVERHRGRLAAGPPAAPTTRRRTGPSSRSTASSSCATTPPTTRSSSPAWASTRCGARSTGSSTTPTPGSTPAGSAPWASPCRPPSAPRSASPTAWCGPSTATAASR